MSEAGARARLEAAQRALAVDGEDPAAAVDRVLALLEFPEESGRWVALWSFAQGKLAPLGLASQRPATLDGAKEALRAARAALDRAPAPRRPATTGDLAVRLQERLFTRPADSVLAALGLLAREKPGDAVPYLYRGEVYLWLGRRDEARRDFRSALELRPENYFAHFGLSLLEALEGRLDAALDWCAKAERISQDPPATLNAFRGEFLRLKGRRAEARADLLAGLARKPQRISSWLNLGLVLAADGDGEGAARVVRAVGRWCRPLLDETSPPSASPGERLAPALAAMLGNRASYLVSFVGAGRRMRYLKIDLAGLPEMEALVRSLSGRGGRR